MCFQLELLCHDNIKRVCNKEIHDTYEIYTTSISSKNVVMMRILRIFAVPYMQTYSNLFIFLLLPNTSLTIHQLTTHDIHTTVVSGDIIL